MKKIIAVIVTYNPTDNINKLIYSLQPQVAQIILVDNGSENSNFLSENLMNKVDLIILPGNQGIAAAQNIGILKGLENKAEYFVFFDQDSQIQKDMIEALFYGFERISKKVKLAAVGPIFYDPDYDFIYPQIKLKKFIGRDRIIPKEDDEAIEVSFIISSGTFTSAKAIDNIGLMNPDLFIDYVDTEWCLRAGAQGYKFYALPSVKMAHTIGDDKIKFLFWNLPVHSPWRRYFRMRNMFVLFSLKYVPISMKIREFITNTAHQLLIIISRPQRLNYIKYWMLSQMHGLRYILTKKLK